MKNVNKNMLRNVYVYVIVKEERNCVKKNGTKDVIVKSKCGVKWKLERVSSYFY